MNKPCDLNCAGRSACVLEDSDLGLQDGMLPSHYCAVLCAIDQQCPMGMVCDERLGVGIGMADPEQAATDTSSGAYTSSNGQ